MSLQLIKLFVECEELKFLGVSNLDCKNDFNRYKEWLTHGNQAGLHYLEKNLACRENPSLLLHGAKKAIVFALPYFHVDEEKSKVALYAHFKDYHRILKNKADKIIVNLKEIFPDAEFRALIDTAPILEKAVAQKTEKGFLGKNTCYIHPEFGSFLLIGIILTTTDLNADLKREIPLNSKSKEGGCGPCNLCQKACPTGALNEAYVIDARKCLSYWTIEHRGTIPLEFWPHLKHYYFGCDICQTSCPYNHSLTTTLPSSISKIKFPSLFEIATMGQTHYEKYFGGTSLVRAKRNGLRRNAIIAMTVLDDERLEEALGEMKKDPSPPIGETLHQINEFRKNRSEGHLRLDSL